MKKYDLVLKEKEFITGLEKNEVMELFELLPDAEIYPIELQAKEHECSAMGFITREAAKIMDYDYTTSGLYDFIANILDNMNNESQSCEYEFCGIRIYMSR